VSKEGLKEAEQYLNRSYQLFDTGSLKHTKLYVPKCLMSMAALAIKQGRHDDADQLIQSGIETLELVTGGEHPEVAEFSTKPHACWKNRDCATPS